MRCTMGKTLSGKSIRRKQRHKRLRDHEQELDFIRNDCELLLDFFDMMQEDERELTPEQFSEDLDSLWYSLQLMHLHMEDIIG